MAFQNRQNHLVIVSFFLWLCCLFFLPSMAMAAPKASSFSATTNEDTALTVNLSSYVTATSPVYYASTTYKGTVTINSSTGVAVFTPTANYYGTAAYFKYYVKDATGTSTVAKVSITVNSVSDAPVASAVSTTATEDTAKSVTLSATDADSTSLTYSIVSTPSYGTLGTPSGKYVSYTPSANYNGTDSFTYNVSDGSLTSNTATVSVTVSAANDAPTANAGSTSTTEDTPVTVTLSGSDIDGDALTYSIYSATNGSATVSGNQATFTPTANYTGTSAKFTFKANDGTTSSAAATVTVSITAANDAPTAADVSASTSEDTAKTVTLGGSDIDGDTLTYTIVSGPTNGTLGTPTSTGVQYTPSSNYYGSDSFTYTATDPSGLVSNTATATLTVNAVNDAPTVSSFSAPAISEDEVNTVDLTPYASDIEGDALTFSEYAEYKGTVIIDAATGIATFTPTANYNGSLAYFRYRVQDASGTYSSTAKVSYSIAAVNDAPVASEGSGLTNEETATTVTLSATDVENSSLTYRLVSQPAHGTATLSSRTVTYTPEADFSGEDTFTFEAYETATTSSVSNTATVTMTVSNVNDAPTASDVSLTTTENTPLSLILGESDPDGDALAYSFSTPTNGAVSGSGSSYVYTPNTSYSGSDAFTYTVSDGVLSASANVTMTVTANNETPVADANTATTDEDTAVTITLTGSDAEGEALTYSIASGPANGTVGLSGSSVVYTPTTDFNGSDSFTFTVSDSSSTSAAATVTVTVGSVNDAPVASDVTGSTSENTAVSVTLVASDGDGDALNYSYLYSDHGDVTIDGETMTFTPDTGFGGTATISYRASDGQEASNTATATIAVADASNDAPMAEDISMTVSEDSEKTVTLDASDPEDDAITYAIATEPSYGTLILADDEVLYTPDPDYYGADSFTYTASDGSSTSTAATVALTVIAIPDPVIDCDMTLDSADEQTDATTGVTYWDNLVEVVMDAPATDAQLTELVSTSGGTGEVCKIEQSEMSADEIANLVSGSDTSDTDYGIYRIKILAQASMTDVEAVATTLSSLSYVSEAGGVLTNFDEAYSGPETDVEDFASNLIAAMPDAFHDIQLQGALEYLSAYRTKLSSIDLAISDTGVCASDSYYSWCYSSQPSGITGEFTNFKDGGNVIGVLETATSGQVADMPLGLIGRDELMHGTEVANVMAAESNGNLPTSIGSGIVGSVANLNYQVTSYRNSINIDKDYKFAPDSKYSWDPDTEIIRRACTADVLNLSYGADGSEWRSVGSLIHMLRSRINRAMIEINRHCPVLYVWAGGNENADLDTDDFSESTSFYYYDNDNHIGVQATEDDSTSRIPMSNYGSDMTVAAPGERGTSLAAPLVSGTAGLLKAIDSSLSPTGLIDLLQAGEDTSDTGTPFLDIAASVLLAIDGKNSDYVPMTLKYATYKADQDLATLRDDEGYTSGTHSETGAWHVDNRDILKIRRDSTESGMPPGPNAETSDTYYDWAMQSQLISEESFKIGLGTATDTTDSRTIPVLIAQPQTSEHTLSGKTHAYHYEKPNATINYLIQEDHAQSYCFKSTFTTNASGSLSDGGYQVPLARNSQSDGFTVPYNITSAHFSGNIVKNVYDYWDQEGTWDYTMTGLDDSVDSGDATGYAEMEIPDCDEDVTASLTDNTAAFDSWKSSLESTTYANDTGTFECTIEGGNSYYDEHACSLDDPVYPTGCTCIPNSPLSCHLNWWFDDSPYSPDESDAYLHVEADISDVECNLTLNASSSNGAVGSDVSVSSLGNYVQVFSLDVDDAGSTPCQATANFTVTSVFERSYESDDTHAECMQGSMLRTGKETQAFSTTVTWDFKQGAFPLLDAVEKIQDQLPTLMATHTSWIYEDEGWSYPLYFMPAGIYSYESATTPTPFSYKGLGEDLILPSTLTHGGQITPGFGTGMESLYWSHGLGPIKRDSAASKQWELETIEKLDRSVP